MAEHETRHLRRVAAADLLEVTLEAQVVGQVQLADARGIAAATQVLEQQRLVQRPQLIAAHADTATDVHADPAAADAKTFRLTFGKVGRMAQPSDHSSSGMPHCLHPIQCRIAGTGTAQPARYASRSSTSSNSGGSGAFNR